MSKTHNRLYYINLESGISQWGIPADNMSLPSGWEMHLSKTQNIPFYSNFKKKITKWEMKFQRIGRKWEVQNVTVFIIKILKLVMFNG